MWKSRLKKIIGGFFRRIWVYLVYALSIIVAFILIQCTKEYVSTIEADFEAPVESTLESMSEEGKQVTYNYFLISLLLCKAFYMKISIRI